MGGVQQRGVGTSVDSGVGSGVDAGVGGRDATDVTGDTMLNTMLTCCPCLRNRNHACLWNRNHAAPVFKRVIYKFEVATHYAVYVHTVILL